LQILLELAEPVVFDALGETPSETGVYVDGGDVEGAAAKIKGREREVSIVACETMGRDEM
jgi:hypothetical protein